MSGLPQQTKAGLSAAVDVARRVIACEAQGLADVGQALEAGLGESFDQALDVLVATQGHVVVTGMGKSGHIARKIAATMASTGTPAIFVHPGEASHGDLGMIVPGDCVLALSLSGETREIEDVVAYTRRFTLKLIALTGQHGGTLADVADVALLLPPLHEACPMRLAPTTSTTMMLGIGDALAVAAMEKRGFAAGDFRVLHPGGKLGRRLMQVRDLMRSGGDLPLVASDCTMDHAVLVMTEKALGCAGVCDASGRLVGILTDGDLRRAMHRDLLTRWASTVMTPDPHHVKPTILAAEALATMNRNHITCLFICDEHNVPFGILHIHDCLRAGLS